MKAGFHLVSVWFGVIMVLALITASAVFAFTDFMSDNMQGGKRTFFVILLMAYAVYRSIRVYHIFMRNKNEE